jgi:dihydropteroate synthase
VVNDVSGGLADPRILDVAAAAGATYVCMHWRGHSDRMQNLASYDGPGGVVAAVRDELGQRIEAARVAGIPDRRIVLDPGLGFAKTATHNWTLLRGLPLLQGLGFPLLVGASRKSFLGTLLAGPDGRPRPVDDREDATTALTVLVAQQGVWGIRVHDVRAARDALRTLERWEQG